MAKRLRLPNGHTIPYHALIARAEGVTVIDVPDPVPEPESEPAKSTPRRARTAKKEATEETDSGLIEELGQVLIEDAD